MRLKVLLPFLGMIVLAGCSQAVVSTGFYDIQGNTAQSLDRDIKRKGPLKGHALASAAIQFEPVSIVEKEDAQGCSISRARIKVIAKITLPRWKDRSGADADLKRAFNGLSRYAKAHEKVHVKIANFHARSMEKSLTAIKPQSSCEKLQKVADRVIKSELAKHRKAQNKFDSDEQRRLSRLIASAEKNNT